MSWNIACKLLPTISIYMLSAKGLKVTGPSQYGQEMNM